MPAQHMLLALILVRWSMPLAVLAHVLASCLHVAVLLSLRRSLHLILYRPRSLCLLVGSHGSASLPALQSPDH